MLFFDPVGDETTDLGFHDPQNRHENEHMFLYRKFCFEKVILRPTLFVRPYIN